MVRRRRRQEVVDDDEGFGLGTEDDAEGTPEEDGEEPRSGPFGFFPGRGGAVLWTRRETFGPYVRALREARSLSLREAAAELGVSFTYLHKLETGGRTRAPTPDLLQKIAEVFGRDVREVLAEAGFDLEVPRAVAAADDLEARFVRLVTHPTLRPLRMSRASADHYSRLHMLQWIDFARRLEAHVRADGAAVDDILTHGAGEVRRHAPEPEDLLGEEEG